MQKVKSLFVSDFHLGNKKSQPRKILKLLNEIEFENLFLIGDIFDITNGGRWNKLHYLVVRRIAESKANIFYFTGNHDFHMMFLQGLNIGNIKIIGDYIYTTVTNKKIYVCHGDAFDGFIKEHPFLYKLGDMLYEFTHKLNKPYNYIRRKRGKEYKSLSQYLKSKVKKGIAFINDFKTQAINTANENNCDGIMMGHVHTPEITSIGDKMYYNTGDFCESCSYIVEDFNGNFILGHIK